MVQHCPSCGTVVDESGMYCPSCGESLRSASEIEADESRNPSTEPSSSTKGQPTEGNGGGGSGIGRRELLIAGGIGGVGLLWYLFEGREEESRPANNERRRRDREFSRGENEPSEWDNERSSGIIGNRLINGGTVQGRITADSPRSPVRRSRAEPHYFQGLEEDRVEISMESEDFDTYLLLVGPTGNEVDRDDDGGTDVNSRLTTTLPQDGEYTVWAGSYSGGGTGSYTITFR